MNVIFFFFFFISYVSADLAKGVADNFNDKLTTFPYDCLALNKYSSVFIGSEIRNDIQINPLQYLAIQKSKLSVELKVILDFADPVTDTETPDIVIDRINGRLLAINVSDPQHLWIDVESILVDNTDSDFVRQYLITFTGYAANLQWTVGYFSTRLSWMTYTADWNLPSSKNQLLWDKDAVDLTKQLIPYGGWNSTSAVIANSIEQACGTNFPDTTFDKTAFDSRVPVWLAHGPTTPLVVSSTMGSSLSTSTNTASTNSTAAPANTTLSSSTVSSPASSTLSSASTAPSVAPNTTVAPATSTKISVKTTKAATTTKPRATTLKYEASTKTSSYLSLISSFIVSVIILGRKAY